MKASDIPNIITLFRFLLVPPFVLVLLQEKFGLALLLFGIAGFSDALDGYLAKHYHWTSRVGALMDPLADKLLLVSGFVTLGWLQWIPLWLVCVVILRDLVIVGGALVYNFRIERLEAQPSMVSKLNTFTQIMLVLAVLFSQAVKTLPYLWMDVLLYCVLVTTLWSGLDYVWRWSRRAWRKGAH
ncbi:MAG TPA: CDP-diacylglycerol--glycerol-3-phosphate 3-phosphatidyltransferase [Gammaproteobacteria bacterium]|nr:CDP-diacylglycerol--glycerol-3-phosphate 3-phosphatidyltransferase [Gammaproteobacteria bacterium]